MGSKLKRALIVVAGLAALALGGAAIATATGVGDDDGSDKAITGTALDRASAAALKHTGGGKVTETEAGDEEGAYEVEVTMADGSQVDVHLDKSFHVVNQSADNDGSGDDAGEQE
jgi:uncharacterized membrane protein YkoI